MSKQETLTKAQANVLEALRSMPAKYRRNNKAGGTIEIQHLDCYDGRTIGSLVRRGLISFNEHGAVVK
jgi:hypothetical protein